MEAWGEEAPAARFVPPEFKAEIVDCASEGIGRWARSRGISTRSEGLPSKETCHGQDQL
jgi:hypothetical protein